jgi:hypothetical protein
VLASALAAAAPEELARLGPVDAYADLLESLVQTVALWPDAYAPGTRVPLTRILGRIGLLVPSLQPAAAQAAAALAVPHIERSRLRLPARRPPSVERDDRALVARILGDL